MEGISLKGDFEQRRSGWSTAGNKAVCSECGNTDRFKAQCPIWEKKKEKRAGEGLTEKEKGRSGWKRKREIGSIRVSGRRNGPKKYSNRGNEASFASRRINLANVLGAMTGEGRTGKRNVLSLSMQALMEEGCVVFLWLNRYVGYLKIFFPKQNYFKNTNRR